jgi:Single-strand binding protein family
MMAADNQTTIAGNLVETPELRFTNTGTPVTNLRVAVTQRIQQDDEWRDGETSFFKVNVWRGQAEHLADSLAKGDRVMVTGLWSTSAAAAALGGAGTAFPPRPPTAVGRLRRGSQRHDRAGLCCQLRPRLTLGAAGGC